MVHLLIPYTPLAYHPDPLLDEFTYGDIKQRGKKLLNDVKKGNYLFLHTSQRDKRVIAAYYVVAEVLKVSEAYNDRNIRDITKTRILPDTKSMENSIKTM